MKTGERSELIYCVYIYSISLSWNTNIINNIFYFKYGIWIVMVTYNDEEDEVDEIVE